MSASGTERLSVAGIIAAGEGSRLQGQGAPKPLVKIGGVPLIERTVRGLVRAGAETVACIVSGRLREVERFLLEGDFGAEIRVLVQTTESSLYSLLALEAFLGGKPFLLAATDMILPPEDWEGFGDVARRVDWGGEDSGKRDALLGVTEFVDDENPLWVETDDSGLVRSVGPQAAGAGLVTSGLYAFQPAVFGEAAVVAKRPGARLRHLLAHLPETGRRVGTYLFRKTVDVDRPEDIEVAEAFIKETEGL